MTFTQERFFRVSTSHANARLKEILLNGTLTTVGQAVTDRLASQPDAKIAYHERVPAPIQDNPGHFELKRLHQVGATCFQHN